MALNDGTHTEIVDIASEERAEGDTGRVAHFRDGGGGSGCGGDGGGGLSD